ncbi:hypothetical protein GCM10028802_00250 [Terrabacter terrigena]
MPVDVRDDAAVGRSLEDLTASRGPLDAVVSSAGVVAYGRLDELEASLFDGVVATNLLGSANVLRHALPGMRAQIYRQAAYAGGPAGRPPPVVWSADKAARVVVCTLDHPRPVVHGGGLDAVTRLGFTLLPRVYDAWVGPLFARLASDPLTRLPAQAGNVAQSAPEGNRLGGGHGSGLRAAVATTTSLFRSRR